MLLVELRCIDEVVQVLAAMTRMSFAHGDLATAYRKVSDHDAGSDTMDAIDRTKIFVVIRSIWLRGGEAVRHWGPTIV